jgi:class 3 adenylate cyclase
MTLTTLKYRPMVGVIPGSVRSRVTAAPVRGQLVCVVRVRAGRAAEWMSASATGPEALKRDGDNRGVEELPAGTITMLFSDIEGSTALVSRLGDLYGQAL